MLDKVTFSGIDAKLDPILFRESFKGCQYIIDENLVENGGVLKQRNLIDKDFDWSYLIIASYDQKIVGFSLVRFSNINKHNIVEGGYYYISQVAIAKNYQHMGIGRELLKNTLELCNDFPVVSSVLKSNEPSLGLFSEFMMPINEKGNYIRFVDNEFYRSLLDLKTSKKR